MDTLTTTLISYGIPSAIALIGFIGLQVKSIWIAPRY